MTPADDVQRRRRARRGPFGRAWPALVGPPAGRPSAARSPVNQPMIRHWVEAMGDENPVYAADDAARAARPRGVIAPPTMLQAWTMRGLQATAELDEARAAGRLPAATSRPTR